MFLDDVENDYILYLYPCLNCSEEQEKSLGTWKKRKHAEETIIKQQK
jgi:hypothetical protein